MTHDNYQFLGGPYDGQAVGWMFLNRDTTLLPIPGDFGLREFAILPAMRPPETEEDEHGPVYIYERVNGSDGVGFELRGRKALDEAWRQARLKIDPRAKSALFALPDDIRRATVDILCALDRQSPPLWPADQVRKISDDPLYLVNLPNDYRAFVRVTEAGQLELADIAREETIRKFVEQYRKAGRVDETVR